MENELRAGLTPALSGDRRAWRDFGRGLAVILFLLALLARNRGPQAWGARLAAAFAAALLAQAIPAFYAPFYRVWMPISRVLAAVNNALLLGLLYYAVLTPYAWITRRIGIRWIEETAPNRSTWHQHQERGPKSLERQF